MITEKIISIEDGGNSYEFKIRKMNCVQMESWIMRAILLLSGGNASTGLAEIQKSVSQDPYALFKLIGGVKYQDAMPLLDELLECCSRVIKDNGRTSEMKMTRANVGGVLSDVRNLFNLRVEAFKFNFDFFSGGGASTSQA